MVFGKILILMVMLVGLLNISDCYALPVEKSPSLVDSFVVANDIQNARADIEKAGGSVRHIFFDDKILIGKLPSGFSSRYVDKIYYEDSKVDARYSTYFNAWTNVLNWNKLSVEEKMKDAPVNGEPLVNDVEYTDEKVEFNTLATAKSLPFGASSTDTSSYMVGDISVSIIFPESNGAIDSNLEDWEDDEIQNIKNEILLATDWWAARNPNAYLTFVYNYEERVPTGYEPVSRTSTERVLWINELLSNLGYSGSNSLTKSYNYITSKRDLKNTDWGLIFFVVDSSNDADGKFSNSIFAATHNLGSDKYGPYSFMTYDVGSYGISNMDFVAAHEFGHIFSAMDQYFGSCVCTARNGYLYEENQNCQEGGCLIDVPSIMKTDYGYVFANGLVDNYTRGKIGWQDSDEDGKEDILGDSNTIITDASNVLANGYGQINVFNTLNPYYNSVSINRISNVEYSLGSAWSNSLPSDGEFNSLTENYYFNYNLSNWGNYLLSAKLIDRFNYESEIATYPLSVTGCSDGDNGQTFGVMATVSNFNGTDYNNATDYCTARNTLREYYCNGIAISSVNTNCRYGCLQGACMVKQVVPSKVPTVEMVPERDEWG